MPGDLRQRLRDGLRDAIKERDPVAATALRSALSAIANAESVVAPHGDETAPAPIAKARLGVGSAEVNRRELSPEEQDAILAAEIRERVDGAEEYQRLGRQDQAVRLRSEAAVLRAYLTH
jgi:uncharacterized protein